MKNKKQLLDYHILSDDELSLISGGDIVDDLLANIFIRDTGVSDDLFNAFVTYLRAMATTKSGTLILTGLLNGAINIHISGLIPTDAGALAQYIRATRTIRIGNFNMNPYAAISNFDATGHELFHAYTDIVINEDESYWHDVKRELDANIFSRIMDFEYDLNLNIDINDDNSHIRKGTDLSGINNQQNPAAHALFKVAWDNIFLNHYFSVQDYNVLVTNFVTGSVYITDPSENLTANVITDLDQINIDDIFNLAFNITPPHHNWVPKPLLDPNDPGDNADPETPVPVPGRGRQWFG